MTDYMVIMNLDGELDYKRFSSAAKAGAYIEDLLNETDCSLDNFLVMKGEHLESLMLTAHKTTRVMVGC